VICALEPLTTSLLWRRLDPVCDHRFQILIFLFSLWSMIEKVFGIVPLRYLFCSLPLRMLTISFRLWLEGSDLR